MPLQLKIVQAGEPVLRQRARELTPAEIRSTEIQQLIALMQQTMLAAPGVGLAAPQIGESLQIAVMQDRPEYTQDVAPELLAEQERAPTPLQVIINPKLTLLETEGSREFFEGCLSLGGFIGIVPRALAVTVECLNEHGEPTTIKARGWHARILQHEIDHLFGILNIDRTKSRSFMTIENYMKHWRGKSIEHICGELHI